MLLYYLYQYDYVHKVYYNPFNLLFCYESTIPLSRQINYPFLPLFYHFLPLNGKLPPNNSFIYAYFVKLEDEVTLDIWDNLVGLI